jgi:hypothetical protein
MLVPAYLPASSFRTTLLNSIEGKVRNPHQWRTLARLAMEVDEILQSMGLARTTR